MYIINIILLTFVLLLSGIVPAGAYPLKAPERHDRSWEPPEWVGEKSSGIPAFGGDDHALPAFEKRLSLPRLMDIALSNNPDTRRAWRDAKAAYAGEKQAESEWYPEITLTGRSSHQRTYTNDSFSAVNRRTDSFEAQWKVLLLDLGGRAASVKQARQILLARNFAFNRAFQDVALEVKRSYYGLYAAEARVSAALANQEDRAKALEIAEQKYRAGLVTKLDVLQARSELARSRYETEQARQDEKAAQADMSSVAGVPAYADIRIEQPPSERPEYVVPGDVQEIIDEAMACRPDIASARAEVKAREAALREANSDLWPTLNAGGKVIADRYYHYGSEKGDLFNTDSDYGYTAYISVEWDIFDGFFLYSARNRAREELKAEEQKLRKAELQAGAEVWTRYYAYRTALKQYDYSVDLLKSSEAAYELALASYEKGLKDILDLLRSASDLSEGRSTMISARRKLYVAYAELVHAAGKLYGEYLEG
jgi:outer membrane protein TolC